jgi:hypothetical protein
MAKNEMYSNNRFVPKGDSLYNLSFVDRPASEFNNTEIYRSCFAQESREDDVNVFKDVFPPDMTGVTFIECNLDNCYIPLGNFVSDEGTGCSKRRIKVQNDGFDWIIDVDGNPIEPVNKAGRLKKLSRLTPEEITPEIENKYNTDPKKIPRQYIVEETISKAVWNKTYGSSIIPDNSIFKALPEIVSESSELETIEVTKSVWDGLENNNFLDFDENPRRVSSKHAKKKIYNLDNNGNIIRNLKNRPTVRHSERVEVLLLEGVVTRCLIRGVGKLTRGK